jgi:hypothetical protein
MEAQMGVRAGARGSRRVGSMQKPNPVGSKLEVAKLEVPVSQPAFVGNTNHDEDL